MQKGDTMEKDIVIEPLGNKRQDAQELEALQEVF